MHGHRILLLMSPLLVATVYGLQTPKPTKNPSTVNNTYTVPYKTPKQNPDWFKNNFAPQNGTAQRAIIAQTRSFINDTLEPLDQMTGRKLESYNIQNAGMCVVGCTASPDCHIIKLELLDEPGRNRTIYRCTLYSELPASLDARAKRMASNGKCSEDHVKTIKEWMNMRKDDGLHQEVITNFG